MSGLEKTCHVALAVGLALAAYGTMHGRAQANDCNDAPAPVAIARAPAVIGLPVVKRRVHHKTVLVATAKIELGCMDLGPKFSPVGLPPIAEEELPPEPVSGTPAAPTRARLQAQDWFQPWTDYVGADQDTLLTYCRCFYFGEG